MKLTLLLFSFIVDTIQGEKLKIRRDQNEIQVDNGLIISEDLLAENGKCYIFVNLLLILNTIKITMKLIHLFVTCNNRCNTHS